MKYQSIKKISALGIIALLSASIDLLADIIDYIPFYNRKYEQETIQKEYAFPHNGIINVTNTQGTITVQTWNQSKVSLTALKKALTPEELQKISFSDIHQQDALTIATTVTPDPKSSIDYTLLVPAGSTLNVTNAKGAVKIEGIRGRICVTNSQGSIDIADAQNTIIARSLEQGSVSLKQCQGNNKVITNKGDIFITDCRNSVIASSKSGGNIEVKSACVPSTGKIKLETAQGRINLHLPSQISADLKAYTKRGSITSECMVTLKPRTSKLDHRSWQHMRTNIDGVIGNGDAHIALTTQRGNISIYENKEKTT